MHIQIETPRCFLPLLQQKRFKGARGGRGGAKSWFFAGLLIEEMVSRHIRAACVREVQNSIKDSVKQLLEDTIETHSLSSLFEITDTEIRGPNGSLAIFKGLQNHTAASIKSLEGFNRCFVEEAQTITQRSLDILTPTFREEDAELWFAWNPEAADDPVERLFSGNEDDPEFALVTVNYYDNPWFPESLRKDMERDKVRDPDKYAHVWLGGYRRASEARVFRNWRIEEFETKLDARFYYGADWGFSIDPTVLVRCYIEGRTLFVDREAHQIGCEIDRTPALFDKIEGSRRWPITADSARPETISYMQNKGFRIKPALKGAGSVEDGIEFLKSYDIVVHPQCKNTIDELSMYAYKTDKKTDEVLPVLEDKNNHVIDALRYAVEGIRKRGPVIISPEAMREAAMRSMQRGMRR